MPKNLRFWVYVNGDFAKLTLQPGQSLSHWEGGPTDEGWISETTQWVHEGDHVSRDYYCRQSDCDGRHDGGNVCVCSADDLFANEPFDCDDAAVMLPSWAKQENHPVYDQYAQMMGY